MATHRIESGASSRRVWVQPLPRKRKRFRRLKRLLTVLVSLAVLLLGLWIYLLQVYAPGLRVEARSIPARVHAQLGAQGAPYVALTGLSPDLQHAIVAVEDRRFYEHPGVDPLGMVRAFWVNLTQQHVDQGGSTLEQQLVKRAIVHDDRSVHAKVRTMALAWAVDQEFSKARVLELYLNDAYYGRGAYGAESAAHVYFGTDALHLTISQAAFLAALPQAPSVYGAQPTSTPIVRRWVTVLHDMLNLGYITGQEESQAENTRLIFAFPNP